uniref:Uncharacterized protein n=1 Tax=Anguilla anguilla TaxID=7936 RepID=A0A0E9T8V5_ANGAN
MNKYQNTVSIILLHKSSQLHLLLSLF